MNIDKTIYYTKPEERAIVDAHLLAMGTCIWPKCTKYKAKAFQLCIEHVRSAASFYKRSPQVPNIPISAKESLRSQQENDLENFKMNRPLEHPTGHVYVLQSDGLIKIGYSDMIASRLKHYSPAATVFVIFPGNMLIEKHLHQQFRYLLARGREWFHSNDEIQQWIKDRQQEHGLPPTKFTTGRFKKRASSPQELQAQEANPQTRRRKDMTS